jgi:predicted ATPase
MTEAQRRALVAAAARERGNVCPTPGIPGAAQTVLLRSLQSRGWITRSVVPTITDAGRAALIGDRLAPR